MNENPGPADLEALRQAFKEHYAYSARLMGMVADQLLGDEGALAQQYADRVAYELLQNALDRCHRRVVLAVRQMSDTHYLVVANDGAPVTVDPRFSHDSSVAENRARECNSDFNALCSVHTSNKDADLDFGNKGVGFRSVFSVSDEVRVWSRLHDSPDWWGLEMVSRLTRQEWERRLREDPDLHRGWEEILDKAMLPDGRDGPFPSFYFPMPLISAIPPIATMAELAEMQTLIVLPLQRQGALQGVLEAFQSLEAAHLEFVGLREKRRAVTVVFERPEIPTRTLATWVPEAEPGQVATSALAVWRTRESATLQIAEKARLKLHEVSVAVRWPVYATAVDPSKGQPQPSRDIKRRGALFCYLPTQVECPFATDVHADFQLGIDRKQLQLGSTTEWGRYNTRLIEISAELHIVLLLRHFGLIAEEIETWGHPGHSWKYVRPGEIKYHGSPIVGASGSARHDLWRFLDPGEPGTDLLPDFRARVSTLLFDDDNLKNPEAWERWAKLALRFFDGKATRSRLAYEQFWSATEHWILAIPSGKAARRERAKAAYQALCKTGALVVPLVASSNGNTAEPVERAVPLPVLAEQADGARAERRIFQIRDEEGSAAGMIVPRSLQDRGRTSTAWEFPEAFNNDGRLMGSAPFERGPLLRELRQLPTDVSGWVPKDLGQGDDDCRQRQRELLEFAALLFVRPVRKGLGSCYQDDHRSPGWRMHYDTSPGDELAVGQALATTFLPTQSGEWEPARQLRTDEVDSDWLKNLRDRVPGLDSDRFLEFLGVCAQPDGLLLVEGGKDGVVPPQRLPPMLVEAGKAPHPPLGTVLEQSKSPRCPLVEAVRAAWCPDKSGGGWLRHLLDRERELPKRYEVRALLRSKAWYPVASGGAEIVGARPPAGLSTTPTSVAPEEITVASSFPDRKLRVMWRVPHESPDREMLVALGAVPDLDGHFQNPDAAAALLHRLRQLDLSLLVPDDTNRLGLLEIHQQVVEFLAKSKRQQPVCLLVHEPDLSRPKDGPPLSTRRLAWNDSETGLWIARDNGQREILRQFFPQLPLAAATLGRDHIRGSWFERFSIDVEKRVDGREAYPGSTLPLFVRERVREFLPWLLALAEASRLVQHPVDIGEILAHWDALSFEHVRDVWLTYEVRRGPDPPPEPRHWHKGVYDDVFCLARTEKGRFGGEILFDTNQPEKPPPLQRFAPVLAELLGYEQLEDLWLAALAEFSSVEDDATARRRLDEFAERHGARALVESFRRRLVPLNPDEEACLRDRLVDVLARLHLRLRQPRREIHALIRLTPEDIYVLDQTADLTEEMVNAALDSIAWPESARKFPPRFACRDSNMAWWKEWCGSDDRRMRLLRFAAQVRPEEEAFSEEVLSSSSLAGRLEDSALTAVGALDFNPARTAWEWLRSEGATLPADTGPETLDSTLPAKRRFSSVSRLLASMEWRIHVPRELARPGSELMPKSAEERRQEDTAKATKGLEAEVAFLEYVEKETLKCIEQFGDPAWGALLAAVPKDGRRVRAQFEKARAKIVPLRDALHVSMIWGNAGFDILGLSSSDAGVPEAIRYEVKALPPPGRKIVEIFLSKNELEVHEKVAKQCAESGSSGTQGWKLVGVSENRDAQDFTDILGEALRRAKEPLATLAGVGLIPQGFRLKLDRPD